MIKIRFTEKDISEKITLAPQEVVKEVVLIQCEEEQTLLKLKKEYALEDETFREISHETLVTILGLLSFDDFIESIQRVLNVKQETAEDVFKNLDEFIFSKISTYIEEGQQKFLEEKNTDFDSLNHIDILNEIENPTPSIAARPATPQPTPVVTEEPKKPTLEEALSGVLPSTGGFTFEEAKHPAEPMSQKLDQKLTESTSSTPKEIYVVKKIDPYHEPLE